MKYGKFKGFFSKKSTLVAAVCLLTVGLLAGCGSDEQKVAENTQGKVKVGIIQLVEHPALDASNRGFIDGLGNYGYRLNENLVIEQQNAQGDQSNLNTIAKRFVADKVDLIGAIATPAAQTVANQTKKIPIVGMAITDYKAARLVKSDEKPGTNVTGVSDMMPPEKTVNLIRTILPEAKTVGVIYNASEINSEVQVAEFEKQANKAGFTVEKATVSTVNDVQQATASLVQKEVDAVFLPTDNVVTSSWPTLIKIMTNAKIPVFPTDSAAEEFGALAMYSVDFYKLGVQAGEMAGKILKGEAEPADMPIEKSKTFQLVINQNAASELGIAIPEKLQEQANK